MAFRPAMAKLFSQSPRAMAKTKAPSTPYTLPATTATAGTSSSSSSFRPRPRRPTASHSPTAPPFKLILGVRRNLRHLQAGPLKNGTSAGANNAAGAAAATPSNSSHALPRITQRNKNKDTGSVGITKRKRPGVSLFPRFKKLDEERTSSKRKRGPGLSSVRSTKAKTSSAEEGFSASTTYATVRKASMDVFALNNDTEPFLGTVAFKQIDQARFPQYSYSSGVSELDSSVRVMYIRDHVEADKELARLLGRTRGDSAVRVAGFDLEWRPQFTSRFPANPVALVQIAMGQKILLLQISAMEKLPTKLIDFLDDSNIIKAGVNILGDCQHFYRDYGVSVRSCVELSYLARGVDYSRWPGPTNDFISLARLVHAYTNLLLPKGKTQTSNWENVLTPAQQAYAANDAHAAMALCEILLKRAQGVDSSLYKFDVVRGAARLPDGTPWTRPPLVQELPPPDIQSLAAA